MIIICVENSSQEEASCVTGFSIYSYQCLPALKSVSCWFAVVDGLWGQGAGRGCSWHSGACVWACELGKDTMRAKIHSPILLSPGDCTSRFSPGGALLSSEMHSLSKGRISGEHATGFVLFSGMAQFSYLLQQRLKLGFNESCDCYFNGFSNKCKRMMGIIQNMKYRVQRGDTQSFNVWVTILWPGKFVFRYPASVIGGWDNKKWSDTCELVQTGAARLHTNVTRPSQHHLQSHAPNIVIYHLSL